MALVVGLGNPGAPYARTRHNVGWRVVERLVRRFGARAEPGAPPYRAWSATLEGRAVHLLTPLTYMNLSGEALAAWFERHGETPELLVITDDVYLPFGTLRLKRSGSSGGHRGLESVEAALGRREYDRLRVGVGAAEDSAGLREHVLKEFEAEDEAAVDRILELAADAAEVWAREGATAAMNRFNRRTPKEDSTP